MSLCSSQLHHSNMWKNWNDIFGLFDTIFYSLFIDYGTYILQNYKLRFFLLLLHHHHQDNSWVNWLYHAFNQINHTRRMELGQWSFCHFLVRRYEQDLMQPICELLLTLTSTGRFHLIVEWIGWTHDRHLGWNHNFANHEQIFSKHCLERLLHQLVDSMNRQSGCPSLVWHHWKFPWAAHLYEWFGNVRASPQDDQASIFVWAFFCHQTFFFLTDWKSWPFDNWNFTDAIFSDWTNRNDCIFLKSVL